MVRLDYCNRSLYAVEKTERRSLNDKLVQTVCDDRAWIKA